MFTVPEHEGHRHPHRSVSQSLKHVIAQNDALKGQLSALREEMKELMATSKEARDLVEANSAKLDQVIAKQGQNPDQADVDAIAVAAKDQSDKMDSFLNGQPVQG